MFKIHSVASVISKSMVIVALSSALLAAPTSISATTLENLQAAYNGENNAHSRYLAFAKRAEQEGYGQVASLFRAAARAEKIHATNHAAVIQELGAVPQTSREEPVVKSTRENLEVAIKGETYERDEMYPEFLKQARNERNPRAVRSLNLAKTAETEHANLYSAALAELEKLKGTEVVTYYVCPVCGFTSREADFAKCPSCFAPKEGFEKVS